MSGVTISRYVWHWVVKLNILFQASRDCLIKFFCFFYVYPEKLHWKRHLPILHENSSRRTVGRLPVPTGPSPPRPRRLRCLPTTFMLPLHLHWSTIQALRVERVPVLQTCLEVKLAAFRRLSFQEFG